LSVRAQRCQSHYFSATPRILVNYAELYVVTAMYHMSLRSSGKIDPKKVRNGF
jgi:hypothetical protein